MGEVASEGLLTTFITFMASRSSTSLCTSMMSFLLIFFFLPLPSCGCEYSAMRQLYVRISLFSRLHLMAMVTMAASSMMEMMLSVTISGSDMSQLRLSSLMRGSPPATSPLYALTRRRAAAVSVGLPWSITRMISSTAGFTSSQNGWAVLTSPVTGSISNSSGSTMTGMLSLTSSTVMRTEVLLSRCGEPASFASTLKSKSGSCARTEPRYSPGMLFSGIWSRYTILVKRGTLSFSSRIFTVKDLVELRGGMPLSFATMLKRHVPQHSALQLAVPAGVIVCDANESDDGARRRRLADRSLAHRHEADRRPVVIPPQVIQKPRRKKKKKKKKRKKKKKKKDEHTKWSRKKSAF
ncbi:hypothetical protein CRUP_005830 [Coryphaenoides rupestris]|nr:hypothetical protein CRUP_005830 [Coryphaenoides rupestris]